MRGRLLACILLVVRAYIHGIPCEMILNASHAIAQSGVHLVHAESIMMHTGGLLRADGFVAPGDAKAHPSQVWGEPPYACPPQAAWATNLVGSSSQTKHPTSSTE